jgi:hypothetical protein
MYILIIVKYLKAFIWIEMNVNEIWDFEYKFYYVLIKFHKNVYIVMVDFLKRFRSLKHASLVKCLSYIGLKLYTYMWNTDFET